MTKLKLNEIEKEKKTIQNKLNADLMYACSEVDIPLAEKLIKKGADITFSKNWILENHTKDGIFEVVKLAFTHSEQSNYNVNNYVNIAIRNNHDEIADYLITNHLNLTSNIQYCFIAACEKGNLTILKKLIQFRTQKEETINYNIANNVEQNGKDFDYPFPFEDCYKTAAVCNQIEILKFFHEDPEFKSKFETYYAHNLIVSAIDSVVTSKDNMKSLQYLIDYHYLSQNKKYHEDLKSSFEKIARNDKLFPFFKYYLCDLNMDANYLFNLEKITTNSFKFNSLNKTFAQRYLATKSLHDNLQNKFNQTAEIITKKKKI